MSFGGFGDQRLVWKVDQNVKPHYGTRSKKLARIWSLPNLWCCGPQYKPLSQHLPPATWLGEYPTLPQGRESMKTLLHSLSTGLQINLKKKFTCFENFFGLSSQVGWKERTSELCLPWKFIFALRTPAELWKEVLGAARVAVPWTQWTACVETGTLEC